MHFPLSLRNARSCTEQKRKEVEQSTLLVSKGRGGATRGQKNRREKYFPSVGFPYLHCAYPRRRWWREREGIFLQPLYGLLRCSFFLFSPKPKPFPHIFTLFFFFPTAYKSFCFTIAPSFSHIMEGEIIGGEMAASQHFF